jgi:hypothetical protein
MGKEIYQQEMDVVTEMERRTHLSPKIHLFISGTQASRGLFGSPESLVRIQSNDIEVIMDFEFREKMLASELSVPSSRHPQVSVASTKRSTNMSPAARRRGKNAGSGLFLRRTSKRMKSYEFGQGPCGHYDGNGKCMLTGLIHDSLDVWVNYYTGSFSA